MRRALIALIALSIAWALVVALTGGIDLRSRGIPFRSTDPDRAALVVVLLVVVYALAYRAQTRTHMSWVDARMPSVGEWVERRAPMFASIISAAVMAVGYVYGAHVAGGADSYGYISQADLWLTGDLMVEQPLVRQLPWPNAEWSLTPLGYRPTPDGSAIVPTYSYGLPVLMAFGTLLAGMCGVFLVTPLLGALAVGMTYVLGTQVWSRTAGVVAAALMGTSPAFLFMHMNPMSDVPVSGLFAAALALSLSRLRWAALWTGVVVSAAVAVRPNLLPLGAIFLGWFVVRSGNWRARFLAAARFGLGGLPLIAAIAVTNAQLHGAPWQSGYGPLDAYYAWEYVLTNLPFYSRQLLRTETPLVILLAVPLVTWRRIDAERRARLMLMYVFAAGVWLCYVFYMPYDAWWYLRFYLPAFPPMFVLAMVGCGQLLGTYDRRVLAVALVVAVVIGVRVDRVKTEGILRLWQQEAVYPSAARYVQTQLPSNAVILTVQHSGSVRYYADRLTMRWDWIAPEWWPGALDVLVELGYRPYLLVSHFEEAALRQQFSLGETADAPGTVVAESPLGVVLYDPLREHIGASRPMPTIVSCPCSD